MSSLFSFASGHIRTRPTYRSCWFVSPCLPSLPPRTSHLFLLKHVRSDFLRSLFVSPRACFVSRREESADRQTAATAVPLQGFADGFFWIRNIFFFTSSSVKRLPRIGLHAMFHDPSLISLRPLHLHIGLLTFGPSWPKSNAANCEVGVPSFFSSSHFFFFFSLFFSLTTLPPSLHHLRPPLIRSQYCQEMAPATVMPGHSFKGGLTKPGGGWYLTHFGDCENSSARQRKAM